jgi:hypothetical protein
MSRGHLELKVPPLSRKLEVQVVPEDPNLEPGGETVVQVTVLDWKQRAVPNTEVALVVVDESLLAIA